MKTVDSPITNKVEILSQSQSASDNEIHFEASFLNWLKKTCMDDYGINTGDNLTKIEHLAIANRKKPPEKNVTN